MPKRHKPYKPSKKVYTEQENLLMVRLNAEIAKLQKQRDNIDKKAKKREDEAKAAAAALEEHNENELFKDYVSGLYGETKEDRELRELKNIPEGEWNKKLRAIEFKFDPPQKRPGPFPLGPVEYKEGVDLITISHFVHHKSPQTEAINNRDVAIFKHKLIGRWNFSYVKWAVEGQEHKTIGKRGESFVYDSNTWTLTKAKTIGTILESVTLKAEQSSLDCWLTGISIQRLNNANIRQAPLRGGGPGYEFLGGDIPTRKSGECVLDYIMWVLTNRGTVNSRYKREDLKQDLEALKPKPDEDLTDIELRLLARKEAPPGLQHGPDPAVGNQERQHLSVRARPVPEYDRRTRR
jgi:hypothetical protein